MQGSAKQATAGTDIRARVLDVNPVDGIVDLSLSARFLAKKACTAPILLEVCTTSSTLASPHSSLLKCHKLISALEPKLLGFNGAMPLSTKDDSAISKILPILCLACQADIRVIQASLLWLSPRLLISLTPSELDTPPPPPPHPPPHPPVGLC